MTYKLIYLPRRNQTVSRSDWPRTWRSHAIFASQFPVLTSDLHWMRYCNRIDETVPAGEGRELPGWLSRDYDGVSVAAGGGEDVFDGSGFTPDQRASIDGDELRVFADYTPRYSFYCKETLAFGGEPGAAAVFAFLAKPSGLDMDPFIMRWHREHVAMAQGLLGKPGGLVRIANNRPHRPPPPNYPFAGIGEYWFASDDDAIAAVQPGGMFEPLRDDLVKFSNAEQGTVMLVSAFHGWPKPWARGSGALGKP
jgi:EthD domain